MHPRLSTTFHHIVHQQPRQAKKDAPPGVGRAWRGGGSEPTYDGEQKFVLLLSLIAAGTFLALLLAPILL